MNNGDTKGLITGPHVSNLIAEMILVRIDKELFDRGFRFQRHIDDYECYVESEKQDDKFLCVLQNQLKSFGMTINEDKVEIEVLPICQNPQWIHQLSSMPLLSDKGMTTYREVNRYLDTVVMLAKEIGDLAVYNYAIKVLSTHKMSERAKVLAVRRIGHLSYLYPYLIPLLDQYIFPIYGFEKDEIQFLVEKIYQEVGKNGDYEAMSYALYYAIKYDFLLESVKVGLIMQYGDCILLTMTWLYLMNNKAFDRKKINKLRRYALKLTESKHDFDTHWLFCFEVLDVWCMTGRKR